MHYSSLFLANRIRRWIYITAFGLCLLTGVTWVGFRALVAFDLRLTTAETLAMIPTQDLWKGRARTSSNLRWFRAGNTKANPQLMQMFADCKFPQQRMIILPILGYTGTGKEAESLIDYLRKKCQALQDKDSPLTHTEKHLLVAILDSLGMMARRDVAVAKRFITDLAKGKETIFIPIYARPLDATIEFGLLYYGYMEPEDLKETVAAALRRTSPEMRQLIGWRDFSEGLRFVKQQEKIPIWRWELDEFRDRVRGKTPRR
jgi:hypothetical protein